MLNALQQRFLIGLTLFASLNLRAQTVPPTLAPASTIALHTKAEWRVNAQVRFDSAGRLLILYRDKESINPAGNWHLLRLSGIDTGKPTREELRFSIPQEPSDPDSSRHWESFGTNFLLTPNGEHAYATFHGSVVTLLPGPAPSHQLRHVKIDSFSSVISFDLHRLSILSSKDVTLHPTNSNASQIDLDGNLLLLQPNDKVWNIAVLNADLQQERTVSISMAPVAPSYVYSCQFRPDLSMECPTPADGDLVLRSDSTVQLPKSSCKVTLGFTPSGFGKDDVLKDGILQTDRLCIRDSTGREKLVSADLLPQCTSSWQVQAPTSFDGHSALATCFENGSFLDTFFYLSKAGLLEFDAATLKVRAFIKLYTRRRFEYAVSHHQGMTTVAVVDDATELKLYRLSD